MYSNTFTQPDASELRLERLPRVLARTGLSRSTLYELIRKGEFSPVRLGERAIAFDSRAVDAWINSRIAERHARKDRAA